MDFVLIIVLKIHVNEDTFTRAITRDVVVTRNLLFISISLALFTLLPPFRQCY